MDVRPIGSGPTGTNLTEGVGTANPAPKIGSTAPASGGGPPALDAAILSALSEADLSRLMTLLEPQQQNTTQASELLQVVFAAAAAGEVERVLLGVTQLAALDPLRVDAMRNEPRLEPQRAQVDSLLARLATVAKLDAESRIAQATQVVEESRLTALLKWDADPHTLLMIANRLLEAGGYVNAVRAAQVAQLVVDNSHWAPAVDTVSMARMPEVGESAEGQATLGVILPALRRSWSGLRGQAPERVARLWRKAPLLVLLVTWLVLGTAGGLIFRVLEMLRPGAWPLWVSDAGFAMWAVGFLALVLFGLYMRVRHTRL